MTDRPVLKAGANFHRYKVKRSCRQKVRGCALNSVEHPNGKKITSIVRQLIKSSRQAPPGLKVRRNAARKLFFSSQRATRLRIWRWPRVCTKSSTSLTSLEETIQPSTQERFVGPHTLVPGVHHVKTIHRVSGVFKLRELHSFSFCLQ